MDKLDRLKSLNGFPVDWAEASQEKLQRIAETRLKQSHLTI
jgi:hypothetical protein